MIAAHLSQGDSEIWIKCFNLNKQIGNTHQAEYCISRAVKVEKDNPYLLYEKAIINEELSNFRKAATTYKKLLEISDSNCDVLVHTGNIYEKVLGNADKAKNLLKAHFPLTDKKLVILNKLFWLMLDYSFFEEIIDFYESYKKSEDRKLANENGNGNSNEDVSDNSGFLKLFDNFVIKVIVKIALLALEEKEQNQINIKNQNENLVVALVNPNNTINKNNNFDESKYCDFKKSEVQDEIFFYFKELLMHDFKITLKDNENFSKTADGQLTHNVFRISKQQFQKFLNKLFEIYNLNNSLNKFISFFEKLENEVYGNNEANTFFKNFDFNSENKIKFNYELELNIENFVLLSDYFSKLKQYEKSIDYLNRALYFSKLKTNGDYVYLVLKLSEILNLKGDYAQSLDILTQVNVSSIKNKEEVSIEEKSKENFNDQFLHKKEIKVDNNNINKLEDFNRSFSFGNNFHVGTNTNNNINLGFELDRNEILDEQEKCEKNYLANLIFHQENPLQGENYENDLESGENDNQMNIGI